MLSAVTRSVSRLSAGLHILSPQSDLSKLAGLPQDQTPEALIRPAPSTYEELPNGLRVVTEASCSPLAHVTLTVGVGSRYDGSRHSGLASVLARAKQVANSTAFAQLEDLGASVSVECQREVTQFHLKAEPERLPAAFAAFAEIVTPKKLPQAALDKALEAAKEDLTSARAVEDVLVETAHAGAFRGHPLSTPILGSRKSLQSLLLHDLAKHQEHYYLSSRMTLAATGSVAHAEVVALAKQHLRKLRQFGAELQLAEPPALSGSLVKINREASDRSYAGVFFRAPSRTHEDYYAFQLLTHALYGFDAPRDDVPGVADLDSCRCQKWLRDIGDVTSHTHVWASYSDSGLYGHIVGCWGLGVHLAPIATVRACVHSGGELTDLECARAKNSLFRSLSTQSSQALCREMGLQALYLQRRVAVSEVAARVALMDAELLRQVARRWFRNTELAVVFHGAGLPDREYGVYRSLTTSRK